MFLKKKLFQLAGAVKYDFKVRINANDLQARINGPQRIKY